MASADEDEEEARVMGGFLMALSPGRGWIRSDGVGVVAVGVDELDRATADRLTRCGLWLDDMGGNGEDG